MNMFGYPALPRGRRLILWLIPLALLQGVLAGLRWPQLYTVSHLVIDYHFGFGKRGVTGTILAMIAPPPYGYVPLACVCFGVFALWLAVLACVAWRPVRTDTGAAAAVVLFLLSVSFASLVNTAGRGEHFGLALALPCLLMPAAAGWLGVRAALAVIAVLIQESNLPIAVALIGFDAWAALRADNRRWPVLQAVAMILPAVVVTAWLGQTKTACDSGAAQAYFQHLVGDFPFQMATAATLCRDAAFNRRGSAMFLWGIPTNAAIVPVTLAVCLPATVFNLVLTARALRFNWIGLAAAVVVTLAPLALLAVAVDGMRFASLVQCASLLVLLSALRRFGVPVGGSLPAGLRNPGVLAALAALQLGCVLPLTDTQPMLRFPFLPLIDRVIEIAAGRAAFVVVPDF